MITALRTRSTVYILQQLPRSAYYTPRRQLTKLAQEEHMLINTGPYAKLLNSFDLTGVTVVEFGAGDGALTREILKQNPNKLIAYELSAALAAKLNKSVVSPVLELRVKDFTKEEFSYMKQGRHVIISNPPYSTIPFLQEQVIQMYGINDVIMMTSPGKRKYFKDYELVFSHSGNDFSPPASGEHWVMKKGFKTLIKRPDDLYAFDKDRKFRP